MKDGIVGTNTEVDYVKQYATNIHEQSFEEDKESDGELSEVEDYNTDGEDEPAGAMDDVWAVIFWRASQS